MYCASSDVATGWGPRGLAAGARPLPLRTRTFSPEASKATPVGYQPVGMKPIARLSPGRRTSTTATVLLSAFATRRVPPSGERARALGVLPSGASGRRATPTCSIALREARSTAHTAFVLAQATKRRAPSRERTIAFGCSPTTISPSGRRVTGSKRATRDAPHTETKTVRPSGDTSVPYASAGSVARASTRPVSTSTAASDSP